MHMYATYVKRIMDIIFSAIALLLLAVPMLVIALVIKLDDPGPVVFRQKRVGKGKTYFTMYKFRSMKMDTPDIPTHLVESPQEYLTRSGRLLRKLSLDELPQFLNLFAGQMSVIGPRPALWNQYDLVAERDRYGANDAKPGLTGWAQVNGRDELEIPVKAAFAGQYVDCLKKGGWKAVKMDMRCFFGTFLSVLRGDGVVEGGTGSMTKEEKGDSHDLL